MEKEASSKILLGKDVFQEYEIVPESEIYKRKCDTMKKMQYTDNLL